MKSYKIKQVNGTMQIIDVEGTQDRDAGHVIAEYRLTPGKERAEIAQMRTSLDNHLSTNGGTLYNYQW